VVQEQAEVQEWAGQEGAEWVAQERALVQMENAYVLSVERLCPMKLACPVITENAQNVEQKWIENEVKQY
jgi:hypothetical protein